MRVVNVFQQEALPTENTLQSGLFLFKEGGANLAKMNPAVVWVNASVAVFEATASYLNYVKEREITRQILAENRAIEAELKQQLKQLKLGHLEQLAKMENRDQWLKQQLKERHLMNRHFRQVLKNSLVRVRALQRLVQQERENQLQTFQPLHTLQTQLDCFVRECLLLLLGSIDEVRN